MQPPQLAVNELRRVAATCAAGQDDKVSIKGLFQVLNIRQIVPKEGQGQASKPRYRMRLNDGQFTLEVMLATQTIELVNSGVLVQGAIVHVEDFLLNLTGTKRMIICFNCSVAEQYGIFQEPIVFGPNPDLLDAQKALDEQGARGMGAPAPQQQSAYPNFNGPGGAPQAAGPPQGGYGAPANGGSMYGGPPPVQGNGYQQGPPSTGMYGGPPPPMAGQGNGIGGYNGGGPAQQQGGMYGGPPPQQAGGGGYGRPQAAPQQAGFQTYPAGGGGGAAASRPPPQYQAQGAIARDEAPPRLMPISALNPYVARWTIRGRVTSKGELKRWSNARGEGKLFSFDLLDRDGGEIRATAFGQEAEKFFDVIEVGGIYQLSKASLKPKKPQFNHTNHNWEINLERASIVERVPEDNDTAMIPTINYNFRRINELETTEAGGVVDIVGLVETCEPWVTITRKTGEETQKRSMTVRDDSGRSIEVTLWGALVSNPGDQIEQMVRSGSKPVLVAKGLRVGDFNGKTLSTVGSSNIKLDPPDIPAAQRLRSWYEGGGRAQAANPLSALGGGGGKADRRTTFSAIKGEQLGTGGKPDWITVSAVLDMIKTDQAGGGPSAVVYPSCPFDHNGRPCQKKMMDLGGAQWSCERCQKHTDAPVWRYLVSMSACDHTAKQYLTAFGDAGDAIFGRSAAEVRMLEQDNPQEFDRMVEEIRFTPMVFRLKVAEDNYNDESRIKVSIYRVERLTDYAKEAQLMLKYIDALEKGQPVMVAGGPGGGAAAAGGGGGRGAGGGGYQAGAGQGQYGGPQGGGVYGSTAPPSTNPYVSAPPTNPYGAAPQGGGGAMGGPPPRTPPPGAVGGGGGGYGGAGGYNQQGGGGGSGGRYDGPQQGGGTYGGPPQQYQQQGGGGGGGGGGGWNQGGGGYGGPQGGPPQGQGGGGQGNWTQGGPGQGGGGGGGGWDQGGGGGWNQGAGNQGNQGGNWNQGGPQQNRGGGSGAGHQPSNNFW